MKFEYDPLNIDKVVISKLHQKIKLDDSKKHDTPFGNKLTSRNIVAVILSFMGRGPEIA